MNQQSKILKTIFTLSIFFTLSMCHHRNYSQQKKNSHRNSVTQSEESLNFEKYPQPLGHLTLEQYTNQCVEELGELPNEINCHDGLEVHAEDVETRTFQNDKKIEGSETYKTCSNPTLALNADESCDGSTLFHRVQNSKGTEIITICRKQPKSGSNVLSIEVGATIAHNPKSGATCFFKYKKNTPFQETGILPGMGLPFSGQQNDPRKFWETPAFITNMAQGSCVNCHSGYPWIRGPHTLLNKEPLLNKLELNSPYYIVAREKLEKLYVEDDSHNKFREAKGDWTPVVLDAQKMKFSSSEVRPISTCLSCHRLGQGRILKHWAPSSLGIYPQQVEKIISSRLSQKAMQFPQSVWHLGNFGGNKIKQGENTWKDYATPFANALVLCGLRPRECSWTTLPEANGNLPKLPDRFQNSNQMLHEKEILSGVHF